MLMEHIKYNEFHFYKWVFLATDTDTTELQKLNLFSKISAADFVLGSVFKC